MFFCCGGSEGVVKGNFLQPCTKCDTDQGWWWQLLNILGLAEADLQWNSEVNSSHRNQPKHGSRRCVGEEESVPYPAVIPHPGTFRNNLAGFSVSPARGEMCTRKIGTSKYLPGHPDASAYELPAVFSLHFQSGLSLKLQWVSCRQHYLWVFFCFCFVF